MTAEQEKEALSKENLFRWGTGEVRITRARLISGEGQESDVFDQGKKMVIRIEYSAREKIEKPVFGLAIYSKAGLEIDGPNTRIDGFPIENIEGKGYVEYVIDSLFLYEGESNCQSYN